MHLSNGAPITSKGDYNVSQPISFTCAPHLQLCLSMFENPTHPLGHDEPFDPLAECPGAARALADAFDGFEYCSLTEDRIAESVEPYGFGCFLSNVLPAGFDQLVCYSSSDDRYFWALYATKKVGVACMSGVADVQRFRLVWWFPTEGGSPTWAADWSFSQDYHVKWQDAQTGERS